MVAPSDVSVVATLAALRLKSNAAAGRTTLALSFYENCEKYKIQDIVVDPILTTNVNMNNSWQWMNKELRAKRQTFRKEIK